MDKSEIKAATVHELGCKFDDMLAATQLDVAKNEGAQQALVAAAKKVSGLSAQVDKDLDEGAFDKVDSAMSVASVIKRYIQHACVLLESGAASAENHRLMASGRLQAFTQMVDNMKKIHDVEMLKSQQRAAMAVNDGPTTPYGRPVGVSPGTSIKERRLAEEKTAISQEFASQILESSKEALTGAMQSMKSVGKKKRGTRKSARKSNGTYT